MAPITYKPLPEPRKTAALNFSLKPMAATEPGTAEPSLVNSPSRPSPVKTGGSFSRSGTTAFGMGSPAKGGMTAFNMGSDSKTETKRLSSFGKIK